MALRKPKKPSFKKLPKQPKATASKQAWTNYEHKLKATEAENNKLISDYKKACADYEAEQRKREQIKGLAAKQRAKLNGIS